MIQAVANILEYDTATARSVFEQASRRMGAGASVAEKDAVQRAAQPRLDELYARAGAREVLLCWTEAGFDRELREGRAADWSEPAYGRVPRLHHVDF